MEPLSNEEQAVLWWLNDRVWYEKAMQCVKDSSTAKEAASLIDSRHRGVIQAFRSDSGIKGNVFWERVRRAVAENMFELLNSTNACSETPIKKDQDMSITIKTTHTINGTDIEQMSADQVIETIAQLEKRIKELSALETKSKLIKRELDKATITLEQVVKLSDSLA